MTEFYDALETRTREEREQAQFAALRALLIHARQHAPASQAALAGIDIAAIGDRNALAALPILRKSGLLQQQAEEPPFGGYATVAVGHFANVFQSPGPIYEPVRRGSDPFRSARALYAAGFRNGDLVHNSFSYHLTPAGFMIERGAQALGCAVFPAGTSAVSQQVQAIAQLRPGAYTGTPDFLLTLVERADAVAVDVGSITRALVSGAALMPTTRAALAARGIEVMQCYATADLGVIAYESKAREGLIIDEGVIVEIVRPGSGDRVTDGEIGEVVVSVFNDDYPLIRFATGDLSAILPGPSPCGRTGMRIKGWMGRADQTAKVKGLFVRPEQIAQLHARYTGLKRIRVTVDRVDNKDRLRVQCESADVSAALIDAISNSVREFCHLRAEVELVAPGTLTNDGKVIDDIRRYD